MIKKFALTALTAVTLGLPATAVFAQDEAGNAEAGEGQWRQCRSCHSIIDNDGNTIQRGGRTGPNLYGVAGRAAGSLEDFTYSERMHDYAEGGAVWTRDLFIEYVSDPAAFFEHHEVEGSRRGIMNYRMRDGQADMWAYLASLTDYQEPAEEAPSE